jgi:hypothetical protein
MYLSPFFFQLNLLFKNFLITTLPLNAREATCAMPAFPDRKLQISESLIGEFY